jgi:hypothetical protein
VSTTATLVIGQLLGPAGTVLVRYGLYNAKIRLADLQAPVPLVVEHQRGRVETVGQVIWLERDHLGQVRAIAEADPRLRFYEPMYLAARSDTTVAKAEGRILTFDDVELSAVALVNASPGETLPCQLVTTTNPRHSRGGLGWGVNPGSERILRNAAEYFNAPGKSFRRSVGFVPVVDPVAALVPRPKAKPSATPNLVKVRRDLLRPVLVDARARVKPRPKVTFPAEVAIEARMAHRRQVESSARVDATGRTIHSRLNIGKILVVKWCQRAPTAMRRSTPERVTPPASTTTAARPRSISAIAARPTDRTRIRSALT